MAPADEPTRRRWLAGAGGEPHPMTSSRLPTGHFDVGCHDHLEERREARSSPRGDAAVRSASGPSASTSTSSGSMFSARVLEEAEIVAKAIKAGPVFGVPCPFPSWG